MGRSILNYPREVGHPIFFFIGIGTHLKHYDNHWFFFHNNKSLDNTCTKTFGNEFKFCIHQAEIIAVIKTKHLSVLFFTYLNNTYGSN